MTNIGSKHNLSECNQINDEISVQDRPEIASGATKLIQ